MAPADPARVIAAARAWIGTPYVTGAALRGVGADCVGLLRGVYAEVSGRPLPEVPPWRPDWHGARGRPLVEAARRFLLEVPPRPIPGGAALIFRLAAAREAHCGISAPGGRVIHAAEGRGVLEVPLAAWADSVAFVALFPDRES